MSDVTVHEGRAVGRPRKNEDREPHNVLQLIGALARDPDVSAEKMQAILTMQRTIESDAAKKAFIKAKIKMRPSLPRVEKRGEIIIHEKGTTKVIQSTPFARFEDIHEAVMPVLMANGFDLDYHTASREGRVVVTTRLSHKDGHSEETTLEGPLDTSGSKNNIQGVGSTLSYLKRYGMCALLNIRTADKGEFDDDGAAAGAVEQQADCVTVEQVAEIRELMREINMDEAKFTAWLGYPLDEMPIEDFDTKMKQLRFRKQRQNEGN